MSMSMDGGGDGDGDYNNNDDDDDDRVCAGSTGDAFLKKGRCSVKRGVQPRDPPEIPARVTSPAERVVWCVELCPAETCCCR